MTAWALKAYDTGRTMAQRAIGAALGFAAFASYLASRVSVRLDNAMIRLVFLAVALFLLLVAASWLYRRAKAARLDWAGIAFAAGFVALAVYLRHATGIGWGL